MYPQYIYFTRWFASSASHIGAPTTPIPLSPSTYIHEYLPYTELCTLMAICMCIKRQPASHTKVRLAPQWHHHQSTGQSPSFPKTPSKPSIHPSVRIACLYACSTACAQRTHFGSPAHNPDRRICYCISVHNTHAAALRETLDHWIAGAICNMIYALITHSNTHRQLCPTRRRVLC